MTNMAVRGRAAASADHPRDPVMENKCLLIHPNSKCDGHH